jgi:hypothetical protein
MDQKNRKKEILNVFKKAIFESKEMPLFDKILLYIFTIWVINEIDLDIIQIKKERHLKLVK